jgi:hypothetical protein
MIMKKLILSLAVLLLSLAVFAQENQHLTFKKVPIDGTLNQFVTKMKAVGFTVVGQESKTAILKGEFAGYRGCTVYVQTLDSKDLVNYVGVRFPVDDTWATLEGDYKNLKSMLTTKYGEPFQSVESFQNPSMADDDNGKMFEVKMHRVDYTTTWETPNGKIGLMIFADNEGCAATIGYVDNINRKIVTDTAIDDL